MIVVALTDDAIADAAGCLRSGGTVVYPTETAYALGADPLSTKAIETVFLLKGRDEKKPMGLIAASSEQVDAWCTVTPEERAIMDRYWPGPLSLVVRLKTLPPREREALSGVTGGEETVSIRVSSNPWAQKLAEALGHPVVATSANRSGGGNAFSARDVREQFTNTPQPDMLLDAGVLPAGPMSTVVRFENGLPVILRHGAITIE